MKRADDFRKLMSSCRPLSESIDFIPEDGDLSYIEEVNRVKPIADNPYEPSELRTSGLKIWDSVYLPMPKSVSLDPKRQRDLCTLRATNGEWESTKETLGMLGRPDGVHYFRPKGPFILDLMNDDIRMLQGAHILAHRHPVVYKTDDYTFGQLADVFLRYLIKLFLARKFGLLLNVHPEAEHEDDFSLYGIEVFGSTALRTPALLSAATGDNCRIKSDKTVVCVLGSVGIEAHPKQAIEGTSWRQTNKWSCLPTLTALAGWECVDYITHAEHVELAGERYHAVPCSDLQPMSSFSELLDIARNTRGILEKTDKITYVNDWFESEDFKRGLSVTPQLPCPCCLRINTASEGVVSRPRSRKPKKSLREIKDSSIPELKEWYNYVQFMQNCIAIGRKATAYALGSITKVTKRNAEARKRDDKKKRIENLTRRYRRKLENGFVSEAEAIIGEIANLKKEINE